MAMAGSKGGSADKGWLAEVLNVVEQLVAGDLTS